MNKTTTKAEREKALRALRRVVKALKKRKRPQGPDFYQVQLAEKENR